MPLTPDYQTIALHTSEDEREMAAAFDGVFAHLRMASARAQTELAERLCLSPADALRFERLAAAYVDALARHYATDDCPLKLIAQWGRHQVPISLPDAMELLTDRPADLDPLEWAASVEDAGPAEESEPTQAPCPPSPASRLFSVSALATDPEQGTTTPVTYYAVERSTPAIDWQEVASTDMQASTDTEAMQRVVNQYFTREEAERLKLALEASGHLRVWVEPAPQPLTAHTALLQDQHCDGRVTHGRVTVAGWPEDSQLGCLAFTSGPSKQVVTEAEEQAGAAYLSLGIAKAGYPALSDEQAQAIVREMAATTGLRVYCGPTAAELASDCVDYQQWLTSHADSLSQHVLFPVLVATGHYLRSLDLNSRRLFLAEITRQFQLAG